MIDAPSPSEEKAGESGPVATFGADPYGVNGEAASCEPIDWAAARITFRQTLQEYGRMTRAYEDNIAISIGYLNARISTSHGRSIVSFPSILPSSLLPGLLSSSLPSLPSSPIRSSYRTSYQVPYRGLHRDSHRAFETRQGRCTSSANRVCYHSVCMRPSLHRSFNIDNLRCQSQPDLALRPSSLCFNWGRYILQRSLDMRPDPTRHSYKDDRIAHLILCSMYQPVSATCYTSDRVT